MVFCKSPWGERQFSFFFFILLLLFFYKDSPAECTRNPTGRLLPIAQTSESRRTSAVKTGETRGNCSERSKTPQIVGRLVYKCIIKNKNSIINWLEKDKRWHSWVFSFSVQNAFIFFKMKTVTCHKMLCAQGAGTPAAAHSGPATRAENLGSQGACGPSGSSAGLSLSLFLSFLLPFSFPICLSFTYV